MQAWHTTLDRAAGPLYRCIADAIGRAVARGELKPGDRLPPHRILAVELGVDLTTVTRAYTEARRRGLLDATVGSGTFVSAGAIRAGAQAGNGAGVRAGMAPAGEEPLSLVDMSMNLPPQPRDPALRALLQDGLANLLRDADIATLMTYRAGAGAVADRAAGAAWLSPVLGEVDPDRVLVCPGAQSALTAVLTTLARPGDAVITEPQSYPGFLALAAHFDIRLVGVPVDGDGMLPAELERACRRIRPKAVYCIPTIQNPTTATMPPERRHALAEIAHRFQVPVIEDDPYGLLPRTAPAAVASMAAGACYVGTLSKVASPGLRTAYLVAPDRHQAARLAGAVRATSLSTAPVMTSLVTAWLHDGTAARLRDAIRVEAVARMAMVRQMLPEGSLRAHPEGLHVWLTLPAHWHRGDFCAHVRRLGVALVPSDAFTVETQATEAARTAPAANAVRIAIGTAPDRDALRRALGAVAGAMASDAPTHLAEIV
jgi:DNA-binding transcriptional MocR family regulator